MAKHEEQVQVTGIQTWKDLNTAIKDTKSELIKLQNEGKTGGAEWEKYSEHLRTLIRQKQIVQKEIKLTSQQLISMSRDFAVIGMSVRNVIQDFEKLGDEKQTVTQLAATIASLGVEMVSLLPVISSITKELQAMGVVSQATITTLKGLLGVLSTLVAGVAAVTAEVALLINNIKSLTSYWEAWARVFNGENVFIVWQESMEKVLRTMPLVGEELGNLFGGLKGFFAGTLSVFADVGDVLNHLPGINIDVNTIRGTVDQLKQMNLEVAKTSIQGVEAKENTANLSKIYQQNTGHLKNQTKELEKQVELTEKLGREAGLLRPAQQGREFAEGRVLPGAITPETRGTTKTIAEQAATMQMIMEEQVKSAIQVLGVWQDGLKLFSDFFGIEIPKQFDMLLSLIGQFLQGILGGGGNSLFSILGSLLSFIPGGGAISAIAGAAGGAMGAHSGGLINRPVSSGMNFNPTFIVTGKLKKYAEMNIVRIGNEGLAME